MVELLAPAFLGSMERFIFLRLRDVPAKEMLDMLEDKRAKGWTWETRVRYCLALNAEVKQFLNIVKQLYKCGLSVYSVKIKGK
jgi:hypothetical protein